MKEPTIVTYSKQLSSVTIGEATYSIVDERFDELKNRIDKLEEINKKQIRKMKWMRNSHKPPYIPRRK